MRVIFMGTPTFACPALQQLIDSPHEVVAVYTAPPRPAHRGKKLTHCPVHQLAETNGLPVQTPASLKDANAQQQFKDYNADIAVVVAYGQILPPVILEATPYGCVNIHPSDLPRWRGAAPIQRTLMAGDTTTAICIMQMDAGLDTGDVLLHREVIVHPGETAQELEQRLATLSAPMVLETLDGLAAETITPVPQSEVGVTYADKISKAEAALDFAKPARQVVHQVHGLSPFPGAYITCEGERIKWLRAEMAAGHDGVAPGMVLDHQLTVQCADAAVRPVTLQRAGKQPMDAGECLRGLSIPSGTIFDTVS